MNIIKYIIVILSFLVLIPLSQAKLYLEPYGSIGTFYSGSGAEAEFFNESFFLTYSLGTRLGYSVMNLSAGLDLFWTHHNFSTYIGTDKVNNRPVNEKFKIGTNVRLEDPDFEFKPLSIGVFASIDLPLLFNIYGTVFYAFGNKRFKTDTVNYNGAGLKLGTSYLAYYVQLKMEFNWAYYNCATDIIGCKGNINVTGVMLSASVPINLFSLLDISFGSDSEDTVQENITEETPESDTIESMEIE